VTRRVGRGTLFRHEQAGGGGWGDPLERALPAIAADLRDGKISRDYATREHGVVFATDRTIDTEATGAERAARRAAGPA
jgi:N-methylhydantoinase B